MAHHEAERHKAEAGYYRELAATQKQLLQAQSAVSEAQDAQRKAEQATREALLNSSRLREQLEDRGRMIPENGVYYHVDSAGVRTGPYCPTCYGDSGQTKRVLLQEIRHDDGSIFGVCGNENFRNWIVQVPRGPQRRAWDGFGPYEGEA